MAKAVLVGPHALQNAEKVKAILEIESPDPELDEELKDAIRQLKHLNNFRDDLVHFGANIYKGGTRTTTNVRKARNSEGLRNFPASPAVLRDATHDLLKIYETFSLYAQKDKTHFGLWWKWHKKLRAAAWRYKPPQERARE